MTNDISRSKVDGAAVALADTHPDVNERQRELIHRLAQGAPTQRAVAEDMGTTESWVSHTLRKPHVAAYAHDVAVLCVSTSAVRAAAKVEALLDARSERVQLEAAQDVLNRAGIGRQAASSPPVSVNIKL
jgi:hypothetical protein